METQDTERFTVTMTPEVKAMLDELQRRGNMPRNSVLATLIQWAIDEPRSPFIERTFPRPHS